MFSLSPLPPSLSVKNSFSQMCRPRAPFFLASPLDLLKSYPFEGDRGPFKNQVKGFPGSSVIKNPPVNAGDADSIPGQEDRLEKEMATYSNILAIFLPGRLPCKKPGSRLGVLGVTKSRTTERLNMHKYGNQPKCPLMEEWIKKPSIHKQWNTSCSIPQ